MTCSRKGQTAKCSTCLGRLEVWGKPAGTRREVAGLPAGSSSGVRWDADRLGKGFTVEHANRHFKPHKHIWLRYLPISEIEGGSVRHR